MRARKSLFAAAGIAILTGCGGNYDSLITSTTKIDVQDNSVLEFRVGTALFPDGTTGLNTVVSFRSSTGTSAATTDTPTITGPAGFVVPDNPQTDPSAAAKNTDVGTNTIRGTPGGSSAITTFGTAGGAFAYGFEDVNQVFGTNSFAEFVSNVADNTALYQDTDSTIVVGSGKGNVQGVIGPKVLGAAKLGAIGNAYPMPMYAPEQSRLPFLLGPPAVLNFHTGNFSSLFLGYDSGFTAFAATPVAGTYTLQVAVPSTTQQNSASFTQSATLATGPRWARSRRPSSVNSTGDGGATFTVAAPPAGVTNQLLYVVDVSATTAYPDHVHLRRPDRRRRVHVNATSGPVPVGATTGGPPFATGDSVFAYVVGSDYDIVAPSEPAQLLGVADACRAVRHHDLQSHRSRSIRRPA